MAGQVTSTCWSTGVAGSVLPRKLGRPRGQLEVLLLGLRPSAGRALGRAGEARAVRLVKGARALHHSLKGLGFRV